MNKIWKLRLKIWKLKLGAFLLYLKICKHTFLQYFWLSIAWILKKYIVIRNKLKYQYYKLTTYNTDEIWKICGQKCDCWPGTYDYDDGKCTKCEMWSKFSVKLKTQLEKECMAYANHCLTGE